MSNAVLEAPVRTPVVAPAAPRHVTVSDYLAIDTAAARRSEFIEEKIIEMAGASRDHVRIVTNIVSQLAAQTADRDCDVFSNDTRVRADSYYYPDVGVVCGNYLVDNRQIDTLTNPTVLIEVLSRSTQQVDQGIKRRNYLRLPSLRTYLLVSQDFPAVEQYERIEDGEWRFIETEGLDATVMLPAIDCQLPLIAIYRRVAVGDLAERDADAPNDVR